MSSERTVGVSRLEVTVLVDDVSSRDDLRAEHGFAALLATDRGTMLFDVGATAETLLANARTLDVDLSRVTAVALSHGHYDHTGGLAGVLAAIPEATVYMHPRTTVRRWSGRRRRNIGMSAESIDATAGCRVVRVEGPLMTPEGLLLSGPVPGPASPAEKGFRAEVDGKRTDDDFVDEMFLLARTSRDAVLVSGCCHRGLVNTLDHARSLTGGDPVGTVIGGLHLRKLEGADLDAVIVALHAAGTGHVIAGHCTGDDAVAYLSKHTSLNVETFQTGFTRTW